MLSGILCLCACGYGGRYVFTVEGDRTYLNGEDFLVIGLRCSNTLISDETAEELISNLDAFASYGINTVSVFFMGSRFGDVKGYREDGSLDPVYAKRMCKIIDAADKRGMVVLVGCLYWSNSKGKWASWGQAQADAAVANTVAWLKANDYRNVFVDVDNEGMARKAKGFDNRRMVIAGKAADPECVIATNFKGDCPAEADLGIHHSNRPADRPYIESEATPHNAPGGYWGSYSKRQGYYNYINIGLYSEAMKAEQIARTDEHLKHGYGYMLASTWLQCVAPFGPNMRPGGCGGADDPGIKWWLEHIRETYGAYEPPKGGQVGLWDRFETAIRNDKEYDDAYRNVTLNVTYTKPDGSKVDFRGFYDGGRTWRIRFMPDELGWWRWRAEFSDGTEGGGGSFECVASDIEGMISADSGNPMWFGFTGGGHILIRGLHVGDRFFASNWPAEKRIAFLDWFQGQGYNTLSIASHYLNRDVEGRGRGWETPRLWPLDAAEYRRLEGLLDGLAERKIIVYPFAGFFGKNSNYPRDEAEQELYVRYTLARLGAYWNVLSNVAGPEPNVGKSWMTRAEVERLGRLIRKLDVFGHPLSVHNRTGDDPYQDSSWTSYGILQGPKTTDRKKLSDALVRNHHLQKPLLAQETLWGGNKHHPAYTADDIRKNAYVIVMSGAALCFGDMDGDSSSGFGGSMELSGRHQEWHDVVKDVWDFFETMPWYRMSPANKLVDNGYCLAEPERRYLVYMESGGTVNVEVAPGEYAVEWIDAYDTQNRRQASNTTDGRGLRSPSGGDDWLVYLARRLGLQ